MMPEEPEIYEAPLEDKELIWDAQDKVEELLFDMGLNNLLGAVALVFSIGKCIEVQAESLGVPIADTTGIKGSEMHQELLDIMRHHNWTPLDFAYYVLPHIAGILAMVPEYGEILRKHRRRKDNRPPR